MTSEDRLAQALGQTVAARLDNGVGFVRLPELLTPFPLGPVLEAVAAAGNVRVAVFLDDVTAAHPSGLLVTSLPEEVIDWRNDGNVVEDILIIGDLDRPRASGLASVPTISALEVRRSIFDATRRELIRQSAPVALEKLLELLRGMRYIGDLRSCANYCDVLLPLRANSADQALGELWRLGLFPDTSATQSNSAPSVNAPRLRANADLVSRVRSLDATTLQRLVAHLSDFGEANYGALRLFANTGQPRHLASLDFESVKSALRSAVPAPSEEQEIDEELEEDRPLRRPTSTFVDAVTSAEHDESDFLAQLQEAEQQDGQTSIGLSGATIDWEMANLDQLGALLTDASAGIGYERFAGSTEVIAEDEPDPTPGRGTVRWQTLDELIEKLRRLEVRAPGSSASFLLERIVELRTALVPYVASIPREGVRLFLASRKLAESARGLIDAWLEAWEALAELRRALPDADKVYLQEVAEELAIADLRVVSQGTAVTAYVLPLHPIVLEPRVRAAELFRKTPYLGQELFDLVISALDPSVPSITVPIDRTFHSLSYSGQFRALPEYRRQSRRFHSPDAVRVLRDVVERFSNVHPYARLSLRVALIDPSPETAKQLLKWLASEDTTVRRRVVLDTYILSESAEDVRASLNEATEELVSTEISPDGFDYRIVPLIALGELSALLRGPEGSPHILAVFDPAEASQASSIHVAGNVALGSLITEWEFSTNPLEDSRPVIRPRSGSSSLTSFLEAQASVFGTAIPLSQRSPLLSAEAQNALSDIAHDTTWVTVCQGASALVAPSRIGDLELLGRGSSGSHNAYVYSTQPAFLLEPVLRYLQESAWIHPDRDALVRFLLGTLRQALPEGLLGFYKRHGTLSSESVLARVGFAAAVAYLEDGPEHANELIVSLDTEGARRWLGLRDTSGRRADLIRLVLSSNACTIEVIEVKARTNPLDWSGSVPEAVSDALEQVEEMDRLLKQMFRRLEPDDFTPSRHEVLKRQVFLEALQQWEPLRLQDFNDYEQRIAQLNALFDGSLNVTILTRIFVVSPSLAIREAQHVVEGVPVVELGLKWFEEALQQRDGGSVEIPAELLDALGAGEGADEEITAEPEVPETADKDVLPAAQRGESPSDRVAEPERAPAKSPLVEAGEGSSEVAAADDVDVPLVARQLRAALAARGSAVRAIDEQHAVIGPSIVQIPFLTEAGARLSALQAQEEDLARDLGVQAVRIANFPGRPGYAVAELPRAQRQFPDVTTLSRPDAAYITVALGAQLNFEPYWAPLDELPHLLVAGMSGSGKSVFLRSVLWQLTNLYDANELDITLIDPKGLDYIDFSQAPHFKEADDFYIGAAGAVDLLADIVEVRLAERLTVFREYAQSALASAEPRTINNLRSLIADAHAHHAVPPLRPMVVIVDEFAELLLAAADRRRFETLVTRFNQFARAVGGHLIAATQRPSVDIITGVMKSNFSRVALRVQQAVDSRVIIDENGAEQLVGRGDLLFRSSGEGLVRLQGYSATGPFVS